MSLVPSYVQIEEDQATLVEAATTYAREELLPLDRKWDAGNGSVHEVLPTLGEMGFLNILIPEDLGGMGCPFTTYAAILHAISSYSPATCVTISVHSLVGTIVSEAAAEPFRSECLSGWGSPENFAAFALTEADAGSDAASVRTKATKVDGGFRINGEKMWITNGDKGRWFLTLARLDGVPERDSLCAFLVDGNQKGLERTSIHGKMGIRGSETSVIHYSDVFVPDAQVLGEPGRGLNAFLSGLNHGRIGIASQASGIADACLSEMISYAGQREQFGRPIGRFQAVGNMIAESAMDLEAAKALIWRAASRIDAHTADRRLSSMAKLYASEAANRIAYRAVQVHGGTGYVNECRVEQLYRDARVTTIYEGTSEVQRLVIAKGMRGN